MLRSLTRLLAPVAVVAALVLPAAPATAAGGGGCPGQFLVYQPAPAGPLWLAANSYTINVLNLSCSNASQALSSFIGREDLPPPWTADAKTMTFRGGGGSFSISAPRPTGPLPGGGPRCPGFSVTSDDRVGSVPLPKGQYAVSPAGKEPLDCLAAARLLIRVLDDPAGELPGAWVAADGQGPRAGAVLHDRRGRTVQLRWLDGRTAGGGHTGPGSSQ